MSTVADNSNLPASSTITVLPDILPFGVLAVVVCLLVILVLVTALGTCICCMERRRRVKGGGEESGYWAPEDSDLSDSSSFTGEILREEESTVSVVMDRLEASGQHSAGMAPPSPSIFCQGDFLMEDVSEAKLSLKAQSPALRKNSFSHVTDMVDDIQDLSYYRTLRTASTVALQSVDLDSPVLSQGGDTIALTAAYFGDERALEEGGWLLYSVMREIQNSSKDESEDKVFNLSKEKRVMNSKLEKRKSIHYSQEKDGLSSKKEVENVLEKKNIFNRFGQVLVDHRTIIQHCDTVSGLECSTLGSGGYCQ